MKRLLRQLFKKAVDVKPNKLRALGSGFVFNFLVLASYYVVRPIRDEIGAWSYPLLTWLGLGQTGISFVAASLAARWCGLSLWLG